MIKIFFFFVLNRYKITSTYLLTFSLDFVEVKTTCFLFSFFTVYFLYDTGQHSVGVSLRFH